MASWFNLGMHSLVPEPNRVIAAGQHPVGGKFVTPTLGASSAYKFCQCAAYVMSVFEETETDVQFAI